MIRISAFVWIIVLGLLGVGLFQVKYNVQSKEAELRGINRQIEANRSAMHVLDAEWSYLNDPTRLADLTRRHTDLVPTQAGQLKHFADLPPRPASAQPTLPALSSAAPSGAGPANPVAAGSAFPGTAPSSAAPSPAATASAAATGAAIIPASATAGSVPTASPAVASPIAAGSAAAAATGGAVKAKAPAAAKVATGQSVAAGAQPAGKPAAGTVTQPGADEVIDAILADMQRKQAGGAAPAAGDQ
ncbi:MAG TPA: hypothetical protein VND94_22090 [Terriglobia bacterium]|nr:hypothetical protein [Terriglobia bacterium]